MATDVIAALINVLVGEAEKVQEAKDIIEANKQRREVLRDAMIEADQVEAIDEVSGYKVVLDQQMKDVYVVDKLLPILSRPELIEEVYYRVMDPERVTKLIDLGIVTRAQLVREGALVREPRTRPFIKLIQLKGVRP